MGARRLLFGVRTSPIALGVVLLLAAGCRDVLGIHAARGGSDSSVFNPALDPDASRDAASPPSAADAGDANGSDAPEADAGDTNVVGADGGTSGQPSPAAGSGGAGASGTGAAGENVAGAGRGGTSAGTGGMAGGTAGGPSCSDACSLGDSQCLSSSERQVCGLVDGCMVWTTVTPCGEREMCIESGATASCTCQPAPAGCENGTGSFCSNDAHLETCAADENECIYKASTTTCPAGKPCVGNHPSASCSCDEPDDCSGVTGGVCRNASQVVTCARNSEGCLAVTGTESCPNGTSCTGTAGGADCRCPAAPAVCMGATSGNVCQSDTSFAQCTSDSNGCVTAAAGTCNALKPCRGNAGSADCACLNPPTTSQCPANMREGSRCSGSSLIRCGNDAGSCLRVMQTDCPSGVCSGTYPNAACAQEQIAGKNSDLGSMQEHVTGSLTGTTINVSATAVLRRFGIISRTAGTHVILALYDDMAGKPHNRIAATSSNTLVAGMNEFAIALPPSQVTLSPGTYWLMLSVDATTQIAHGSASVPLAYVSYTHGSPVPSPLTLVTIDQMPEESFYIVVLAQ